MTLIMPPPPLLGLAGLTVICSSQYEQLMIHTIQALLNPVMSLYLSLFAN